MAADSCALPLLATWLDSLWIFPLRLGVWEQFASWPLPSPGPTSGCTNLGKDHKLWLFLRKQQVLMCHGEGNTCRAFARQARKLQGFSQRDKVASKWLSSVLFLYLTKVWCLVCSLSTGLAVHCHHSKAAGHQVAESTLDSLKGFLPDIFKE